MVSANNAINNTIGASISGVTNTLTITNASNTASSQAKLALNVGGGTAGDAFTTYTVTGVTNWSEGIDNSVTGDPFKISASTALGTTDTVVITTGGAMTRPLQPAFSVYPSGTLTDKTGDGTDYSIVFDTAFLNVGTCVNLTTGVFTAPVAGNYYFYLQVFLLQIGVAHTFAEPYLQLGGGVTNLNQGCYNPATMRALSSNTNDLTLSVALFQTLSANDTVTPHIIVGGSTKTIDLNGGTSGGTFFYGWLVS